MRQSSALADSLAHVARTWVSKPPNNLQHPDTFTDRVTETTSNFGDQGGEPDEASPFAGIFGGAGNPSGLVRPSAPNDGDSCIARVRSRPPLAPRVIGDG